MSQSVKTPALTVDDVQGRPTLTVPEAASLLGVGRGVGYAGVKSGEIPSVRIGGRVLVPTAPLLKLLGIDAE